MDVWREVEKLTAPFREVRARAARRRARAARDRAEQLTADAARCPGPPAVQWAEEAREEERRAVWYEGRERGQRERFARARACAREQRSWRVAVCRSCEAPRRPVALGCDVRRACRSCDVQAAVARRARFGKARALLVAHAQRAGCYLRRRAGGRFAERMLTLTIPHVEHPDGYVATIRARVSWLFDAWSRFRRGLVRLLKETHGHAWEWVHLHRSFEWTPGDDLGGHPHFHLWLHSQWLPAARIGELWTEALRAAGCPVPHQARVHVKLFASVDWRAVRELVKGGRHAHDAALQLSRVGRITAALDRPANAVEYADGWTLSDVEAEIGADGLAALYEALEGRHLSHASRGLFVADEPCRCKSCRGVEWRTIIAPDERTARRIAEALGDRKTWKLQACMLVSTTGPPGVQACPGTRSVRVFGDAALFGSTTSMA